MGSSNQTGNEIDEFVTETLRNNLLGLPLDLPAINMARAREAGVAPLNEVRRQIYAQTNDSQLQPYTSWSDYGQHLKHPESLVNFVAAYGLHPSITSQTTIAGKRSGWRRMAPARPTVVWRRPSLPNSPTPCRARMTGHLATRRNSRGTYTWYRYSSPSRIKVRFRKPVSTF